MKPETSDEAMARLEAEIRHSQFTQWEAEAFLVGWHREPEARNPEWDFGRVGRAILYISGAIGLITFAHAWLISGTFPLQ